MSKSKEEVMKELSEIEKPKIRESLAPYRLVDDNETFIEYKIRQNLIKKYLKMKRKGSIVWSNHLDGTYTKEKALKILAKKVEKEHGSFKQL